MALETAGSEGATGRPEESLPLGVAPEESAAGPAVSVALLPLDEAIQRVDPRLREVMSERLRAEFRQVIRWEAPKAGERPDGGVPMVASEGFSDLPEEEESES